MSTMNAALKSRLVSLCRDFLHEPWASAKEEDVHIVTLSGGVSNYVYVCKLLKLEKSVLVRIFGNTSYDHSTEHVLFAVLAEKHLGPKMLGCFEQGRIEEYVRDSKAVHVKEVALFSSQIAHKLALIHNLSDMPVKKGDGFFEKHCQRFIRVVDKIDVGDPDLGHKSELVNFDYRAELNWLLDHMKSVDSPIVFCHNDLQMNNILLVPKNWFNSNCSKSTNDEERRVLLIDYEYAGFNYRAYDIANHFSECRYDYSGDADKFPFYIRDEANFPDEEQQREFVQAYLANRSLLARENESESAEEGSRKRHCNDNHEEVDRLMEEVSNFHLAPCFFWLLWTLAQSVLRPDIKFGYWEHARDRMMDYTTQKRILLRRRCNQADQSGPKRSVKSVTA